MALRWFLAVTLLSSLLLPVTAAKAQTLDQYGGYTSMPVPGGATGYFRVAKIGSRWVFATPDGNAFWMRGVFAPVIPDDRFIDWHAKYGIDQYGTDSHPRWAVNATKRMQAWGFNTLAEYADAYLFPINPGVVKMPFTVMLRPSYYGLLNQGKFAPDAFKDLIDCLSTAYTGYLGGAAPDIFDPNYAAYVNGLVPSTSGLNDPYWGGLATSPWAIGITIDETDQLYGFGPGPEIPASRLHSHIGWFAVAVSPTKTSSTKWNRPSYSDPKVYTKYALRSFLQAKYSTIAALNTAWGSTYTSWDSAGGWGAGTGFLDEDGRHSAWLGNTDGTLVNAAPGVVTDLDAFLYSYAQQYFALIAAPIRRYAPNQLLFGPASVNGWGGLTRKQILQAAGQYVDVINGGAGSQPVVTLTSQYAGDRPMVTWEGYTANPDSSLSGYPQFGPFDQIGQQLSFDTQPARGQHYADRVSFLLNATSNVGTFPIVGVKFWDLNDSWGEKLNWGLVSLKDNAYDGKEAVVATGTDPWGYQTGGEVRNYGDFLTPVIASNGQVYSRLSASGGGGTSITVSMTSPTSGASVTGTVAVNASASSTASRIDLLLNGTLSSVFSGSTANYPWDTTTVTNGSYQWSARAYDSSGQTAVSSPVAVSVANGVTGGDTTPPTVSITSPANGTVVPRRSAITITATATDDVGVTRVEFYVNGRLQCSAVAPNYACRWNVPAANGRSYGLQTKAYDAKGNVGTSSLVTVTAK